MNIYSHVSASGGKLEPFDFTSELAMEGYLVENPEILKLFDDEHIEIKEIERQWKKGGGNDGRIDLLVSYGDSIFAVVELKNNKLDMEALKQLRQYLGNRAHLSAVANYFKLDSNESGFRWLGVLVGTGITDEAEKEIRLNNSNPQNIPLAVIALRRYRDDKEKRIYTVTNVLVDPSKSGNLPPPPLQFNGRGYTRGRLLLAVVQTYARENNVKTGKELEARLQRHFPNDTKYHRHNGRLILADYDWAVKDSKIVDAKGNTSRNYFIKPEEAVVFQDGTKLAVLSSWAASGVPVIENIASALGYSVTSS